MCAHVLACVYARTHFSLFSFCVCACTHVCACVHICFLLNTAAVLGRIMLNSSGCAFALFHTVSYRTGTQPHALLDLMGLSDTKHACLVTVRPALLWCRFGSPFIGGLGGISPPTLGLCTVVERVRPRRRRLRLVAECQLFFVREKKANGAEPRRLH